MRCPDPALYIEFLESLLSIHSINELHSFILDFFTQKFKLSNCTITTGDLSNYKVNNSTAIDVYNSVQKIISQQIVQMRSPFLTSNVETDFLFKNLQNIDKVPKNILAVPILFEKELLGHIICFSESNIDSQLELMTCLVSKLAVAIDRIKNYQMVEHSALTDSLTGLHNRIYFEAMANIGVANGRKEKLPSSMIIFDIDNFKNFNDVNGHIAGDVLLKDLGKLLSSKVQKEFVLCRYGGEEFVIFLPNTKNDSAREFAESIRIFIAENLNITVSIGVASCLNSSVDATFLLKESDIALYKAKGSGKNKTCQRIIIDKTIAPIDVEDANAVGKV